MDFLEVYFPVSGVKTNILFPPLVAMIISFFTSMAGVSGAFLLLPFQMSILNYTAPSVSGTNHVYNVIAIPGGVYRYIKERRMFWPLTGIIIAGTLPGVFLGYYLRIFYLPDPKSFKLFVGFVLLYIGVRLLKDVINKRRGSVEKFKKRDTIFITGLPSDAIVKTLRVSIKKVEYEFLGDRFSFNPVVMFVLSCFVGIIGGAYGIGGGAIIAPFCVTFFHLPVYTIAGAALMGTFITSFAGSIFFSTNPSAIPDWGLGVLFGIGGLIGIYLGARFQKFVPQKFIKLILCIIILLLSSQYIAQYFFH